MLAVTVRIMGQAGELLGWGTAQLRPVGGGRLEPVGPATVQIEQAGRIAGVVEHLTDLDLRRSGATLNAPVATGQIVHWTPAPWVLPTEDIRLAEVTVRTPVSVQPATAMVGTRA